MSPLRAVMEEDKPEPKKVKIEIDQHTGKLMANAPSGQSVEKSIQLNIMQGVQEAFKKIVEWTKELPVLITAGKHSEAFQLLMHNKATIALIREPFLDTLLTLDRSALTQPQQKDLLLYIIFFASEEGKFGKIENEIDLMLATFGNEMIPAMLQSIKLSKANAAGANGKMNVATEFYHQVLGSPHTSSADLGYANRGLAIVSPYIDDAIRYRNAAVDKFLEGGLKREAVKDLVFLSSQYETKDPERALNLLDQAIHLHDSESALDKEYAAGLHHRKSGYLFFMGKIPEALAHSEIACALRENLLGNEHARYSSNSLALTLCEQLHDQAKAEHYKEILRKLAPHIQTEEFKLEQALQDVLNSGSTVPAETAVAIEQSSSHELKFSFYLHKSMTSQAFLEKIEWLDKAQLIIQQEPIRNEYLAILNFAIAEAYRVEKRVLEAKRFYELALDYNPRYSSAIQNCGAALWEALEWKQAVDFFEKQINRLGETPRLSYAYGRSLYEAGDYVKAFSYFQKCAGKVEAVNVKKYLDLCMEKSSNLVLNSTAPVTESAIRSISITEFKEALEAFAESISRHSRMSFWKTEDSKTYKWRSSPEGYAKQLLITALDSKFGKDGIEIIQEHTAGAGFVDLYLRLRGGTKVYLELKVCGANYPSSYAISGEDQLIHYIKNSETRVGFLVVFDGRIEDYGVGFKPMTVINDITLYTVAVEMSPKVKR